MTLDVMHETTQTLCRELESTFTRIAALAGFEAEREGLVLAAEFVASYARRMASERIGQMSAGGSL